VISDAWVQAAVYIDRILRGARPADLPVETPNTLELVVNMNTAKALGVTIPRTIILRADRVIE
jgi:putative ABC transport system substrate-binding protein